MSRSIKVADLELTQSFSDFSDLSGYAFLQLLVRWHGQPMGYIKVPVRGDTCTANEIVSKVIEEHAGSIIQQLLRLAVQSQVSREQWTVNDLLETVPVKSQAVLPTITVAVCTRDRTEDLALCLSALKRLEFPPLEILVIDNAPRTGATRELIESFFPEIRYIVEPRPGLNWARNRAIAEATGEIVAYTDDDVIVDPLWTRALATLFAENSEVMAVTGLVVPYELETEPQLWFEQYGGFGRGVDRKWYRASHTERHRLARQHAGAGKFGTGANMAYRRKAFSEIGLFDPALDVGTATQGGGDLDMFFRVLKHGHSLVYEPAAIVRHRHRRDYARLHTQIENNGIGLYSHLVRNALEFPEERNGVAKIALWWLWKWNVRRWLKSLFKPSDIPRELIAAELRGCFTGLFRYQESKRKTRELLEKFGPTFLLLEPASEQKPPLKALCFGTAVRTIDITDKIEPIEDVTEYFRTRLLVTWQGMAVGQVEIANRYRAISAARIADCIVQDIGEKLLDPIGAENPAAAWSEAAAAIKAYLLSQIRNARPVSFPQFSISIIVATCDRPDDLRLCLTSLATQVTRHRLEIVVVDNRPDSGLTPPVVAEFPGVRLIAERRGGLSYARNTGFAASTGDLLVCTDDDVVAPPDWLEKLVAPFSRNDVMMVTGNVFPVELETPAQLQFENYGGLGRGFERREFNREWFDSFRRKAVRTWEIGATANAAVRASALHDPAIGLLDEALGAGTPTGCSEDTYLFYKVLKARHTIIYEPTAFVLHSHRKSKEALEKQIYNYSKGHAAYHMTTFLRDRDGRGLVRIFLEVPRYQLKQLWQWARGCRERSLRTLLLEIEGNLVGPLALWHSRRRVKKMGASLPYIPMELRQALQSETLTSEKTAEPPQEASARTVIQ
ncbi:MAG: glycosyltransferase [Verrucomicrobia bacterium]|nr:glycosyltransferase [Verrucomicrobiota bacterium]